MVCLPLVVASPKEYTFSNGVAVSTDQMQDEIVCSRSTKVEMIVFSRQQEHFDDKQRETAMNVVKESSEPEPEHDPDTSSDAHDIHTVRTCTNLPVYKYVCIHKFMFVCKFSNQ